MLILLEGPDGAGKTTLANALIKKIEDRHPYCVTQLLHKGPPTQHPIVEYCQPLEDYIPRTGVHIICDRWHLGELVYSEVLHRETLMTPEVFEQVEETLNRKGALLVHLDAPLDVLTARLESRGDDLIKPEMLPQIQSLYWRVIGRSQLFRIPGSGEPDGILRSAAVLELSVRREHPAWRR